MITPNLEAMRTRARAKIIPLPVTELRPTARKKALRAPGYVFAVRCSTGLSGSYYLEYTDEEGLDWYLKQNHAAFSEGVVKLVVDYDR